MSPLKFVKAVSKTYFAERDKIRNRSKRWWSFTFIVFFSLFLFQIYAAYTDWQLLIVGQAIDNVNTLNPDEFWQTRVGALSLQGVVLLGVFIRFSAGQFRGRWFVRFGEVGEFIAFAAFARHSLWTQEVYAQFPAIYCGLPSLIGLTPAAAQWLSFFFFCWIFYKFAWIIAVTCETVRKQPQCPIRF